MNFSQNYFRIVLTKIKMKVYFFQLLIVINGIATAQRNCYFPEFLHTPTTSTWWSDVSDGKNSHPYENIWWRKLSIENDRRRLYLRYLCKEKVLSVDEESSYCQGWHKIEVNCIKTFGVRRHTYLVEVRRSNRNIYQCLKFVTLDEKPHEIFILHQSKTYQYQQEDSLCMDDQLIQSSMIWIPDLTKYSKRKWTPCLLNGGFQIKNMINRQYSDSKEKCTLSIYVNLECDCLIGEGCEWNFNEATCNPFEKKIKSRFQCYSNWYSDGHNYTILVKKQLDDNHIVITMKYKDIRYPYFKTKYEKFQSMTIFSGLQIDQANPHFGGSIMRYSYNVLIRRSFGICDDEQESCERGCKADSRNQFFCHRSCPTNGEICDFTNHDSCTFKSRYIGEWDLISRSYTGSIKITNNSITFNNTLSKDQEVTLTCIKEHNEYIQDWFMLAMPFQKNGCRVQDVCIQLYQTSKRIDSKYNTNTLFYRISKSSRKTTDFENLCTFEDDLAPLNDQYRSSREKALVKRLMEKDGTQHLIVKCELYKISLVGNITFRSNGPWRCPVNISDYNSMIGSTGEFDNKIRISPQCQAAKNFSWMTSPHTCLSVLNMDDISGTFPISQIITYIKDINSYFCWLVVVKRNESVLYDIHLFETPQCQYILKTNEGITIIKSQAWASMTLQIGQPPSQTMYAKLTQTSIKTITLSESIKNWTPVDPLNNGQTTAESNPEQYSNTIHPSVLMIIIMGIVTNYATP